MFLDFEVGNETGIASKTHAATKGPFHTTFLLVKGQTRTSVCKLSLTALSCHSSLVSASRIHDAGK